MCFLVPFVGPITVYAIAVPIASPTIYDAPSDQSTAHSILCAFLLLIVFTIEDTTYGQLQLPSINPANVTFDQSVIVTVSNLQLGITVYYCILPSSTPQSILGCTPSLLIYHSPITLSTSSLLCIRVC